MPQTFLLHDAGRLPAPGDNVAIAVRSLEAGTVIELDGAPRPLAQHILEGHRFAIRAIAPGEALLSWGLPFGHALTAITAGDYVCNASMLESLAVRRLPFALPARANFADHLEPFELNEATFRPGPAVAPAPVARTFAGYRRPGTRGVGTRNTVVILGTTSRTASFARQLAARLQVMARVFPALDGIVAIAHTEGGGPGEPNNATEVLRALAGFMVHPNVGAVLAVDAGGEPITNARLRAFMAAHGYPLGDVPHAFLSSGGGLAAALAEGEALVRGWLPAVAAQRRTAEPLSALRVALQCGGSDAFSGVSGNPLAGAMVHELVRHGGIGVLCETDEVAGGEAYIMKAVRDLPTARALLGSIARFRARLGWHGLSPEANPSAGNKFRGLYNIALKSLGAVHKKDPRTPVNSVINYGEPLTAPGFYFMDSPGNDLEGIAGQVAAGCNLILFVTGNGSITNFPFVPTLKVTTTTRRHQLLIHEMDINAGRYLDGETMAALTEDSFNLLVETASGKKSRGEHAGHAQTSLWRNWRQTDGSQLAALRARTEPDGRPLPWAGVADAATTKTPDGDNGPALKAIATERVGLVLPTSMCAAQIARLAADRMNASGRARELGLDRFVALTHTEGCGFGGESMYRLLLRTYLGYVTHPNVAAALLLEHGCEKITNDSMRQQIDRAGLPLARFGWASVQLDGGIDLALGRIEAWFALAGAALPPASGRPTDLGALTVGLLSAGPVDATSAATLARLARAILAAGGTVLLPEGDGLLAAEEFRTAVLGATPARATLAYGQPVTAAGLHLVATETDHWSENVAGLGGSGAHVLLGLVGDSPQQGHPMVPVVQVAAPGALAPTAVGDVDIVLAGEVSVDEATLRELLLTIVQRERQPVANIGGFVDFQLSRGLLGVST